MSNFRPPETPPMHFVRVVAFGLAGLLALAFGMRYLATREFVPYTPTSWVSRAAHWSIAYKRSFWGYSRSLARVSSAAAAQFCGCCCLVSEATRGRLGYQLPLSWLLLARSCMSSYGRAESHPQQKRPLLQLSRTWQWLSSVRLRSSRAASRARGRMPASNLTEWTSSSQLRCLAAAARIEH